jgi:hypothetical protein
MWPDKWVLGPKVSKMFMVFTNSGGFRWLGVMINCQHEDGPYFMGKCMVTIQKERIKDDREPTVRALFPQKEECC